MTAAKTMILARFGFADDGVSVGNFAFCHLREATILAFVSSKSFERGGTEETGHLKDLVLMLSCSRLL
jgi:hypothetical protein